MDDLTGKIVVLKSADEKVTIGICVPAPESVKDTYPWRSRFITRAGYISFNNDDNIEHLNDHTIRLIINLSNDVRRLKK